MLNGVVGPGSEWFWAAAQFVVVVISLGGIYRQLRAQGSANAFHQMATLHDRWDSERLIRARLSLALDIRNAEGRVTALPTMTQLCDFFDDIALLQERGHLSRKDVWADWNRTVEFWWTILAPAVRQRRQLYPGDYESFEQLNELMRELDRKAGRNNQFDPATAAAMLDSLIVGLSASLRLEQESRAGVIPTGSTRLAATPRTEIGAEGEADQLSEG